MKTNCWRTCGLGQEEEKEGYDVSAAALLFPVRVGLSRGGVLLCAVPGEASAQSYLGLPATFPGVATPPLSSCAKSPRSPRLFIVAVAT